MRFLGVFERITAGFESLTIEAEETFEGEGRVVLLGYYRGNFRGKPMSFARRSPIFGQSAMAKLLSSSSTSIH